jgi:glycosyltransferase involved in cell wall biosynthesis
MSTERLTVVVAAFNEAEALPALHPRIASVLDGLAGEGIAGHVLYVDDGSHDRTWAVLDASAATSARRLRSRQASTGSARGPPSSSMPTARIRRNSSHNSS